MAVKDEQLTNAHVLLIGDWLVDEYRFVVNHQSDLGSHTGRTHLKTLPPSNDRTYDLCGAGRVARALVSLQAELCSGQGYKLWAMGSWEEAATAELYHFFHPTETCDMTKPNVGIVWRSCGDGTKESEFLELVRVGSRDASDIVLRQYDGETGEQQSRIDPADGPEPDRPEPESIIGSLQDSKIPKPQFIVLFDLAKGVVTKEVVRWLKGQYEDAKWLVRSKLQEPDWLPIISEVEMAILGPEVLARANAIGSWLRSPDDLVHLTRRAYEILGEPSGGSTPGDNVTLRIGEQYEKAKSLVLVTDAHEVIARIQSKCLIGKMAGKIAPVREVGWSTRLFAYLAHSLIHASLVSSTGLSRKGLRAAIDFASSQRPTDRASADPEDQSDATSTPTEEGEAAHEAGGVASDTGIIGPEISLEQSRVEWAQSISPAGRGIISNGGEKKLELWRGSTDLPGYICCVQEKREILNTIGALLREFRGGGRRSISISLVADPGAGKTSLVNALARRFDFAVVRRNITQMFHVDEISDMFDAIRARQTATSQDVLVFVDEINSWLENSPVYGKFLTPVGDGMYRRGNQELSLGPCVWVFAGTPELTGATKYKDFRDRLTDEIRIDLKHLIGPKAEEGRDEGRGDDGNGDQATDADDGTDRGRKLAEARKARILEEARLEQIYLGATLVKRAHPAISMISEDVLKKFYDLDPLERPARTIGKLAESLRNIHAGRATTENWSDSEGQDDRSAPVRVVE